MSLYKTLGVRRGAHPAEIALAYQCLVEAHQDDPVVVLDITYAYGTLIHPQRREDYDRSLGAPPAAGEGAVREPAFQTFLAAINYFGVAYALVTSLIAGAMLF